MNNKTNEKEIKNENKSKGLRFSYIYQEESTRHTFYQLPTVLFEDIFDKLSLSAKVLYSFFLNRVSLSKKNGWVDDDGRVYIYYTLEEIIKDLKISKDTAVKNLAELDEKGYGLIKRVKQGFGKPTKIYVMDFIPVEEDIEEEKTENEEESQGDIISAEFCNDIEDANAILSKTDDEIVDAPCIFTEFGKTEVSCSEKPKSRVRKNRNVEVGKPDTTYIESSNTEYTYNLIDYNVKKERLIGEDLSLYIESLKTKINYNFLRLKWLDLKAYPLIELLDTAISVVADYLVVQKEDIVVGDMTYSYTDVSARFSMLNSSCFEYVIESVGNYNKPITNLNKFLLVSLYNSVNALALEEKT